MGAVKQDFGILDCPICLDGTVYWPVLSWGEGYNWDYGGTEYHPEYGDPFCDGGCILTDEDLEDNYPDEYLSLDVDSDGMPIHDY